MTIVCLSATDECVRIGVDTLGLTSDGVRREVSKVLFLPHLHAVLVGRGTALLVLAAHQQLFLSQSLAGAIEQLDGSLPLLVESVAKQQGAFPVPEISRVQGEQNILLVGYHEGLGRVAVFRWHKDPDVESFDRTEVGTTFIAPLPPEPGFDLAAGWRPDGDASFVAMARAQVEHGKQINISGEWGGHLLLAEVRRGSTSCRTVCEL